MGALIQELNMCQEQRAKDGLILKRDRIGSQNLLKKLDTNLTDGIQDLADG